MASTISALLQTLPLPRVFFQARASQSSPPVAPAIPSRRQLLFSPTATTAIGERSSRVESIGLFGIRKGLRKAEDAPEEIVRGGFEAADKGIEMTQRGIETLEKGIEAAERGIETAEKEIETVVSFDGLAQAGALAARRFWGFWWRLRL